MRKHKPNTFFFLFLIKREIPITSQPILSLTMTIILLHCEQYNRAFGSSLIITNWSKNEKMAFTNRSLLVNDEKGSLIEIWPNLQRPHLLLCCILQLENGEDEWNWEEWMKFWSFEDEMVAWLVARIRAINVLNTGSVEIPISNSNCNCLHIHSQWINKHEIDPLTYWKLKA